MWQAEALEAVILSAMQNVRWMIYYWSREVNVGNENVRYRLNSHKEVGGVSRGRSDAEEERRERNRVISRLYNFGSMWLTAAELLPATATLQSASESVCLPIWIWLKGQRAAAIWEQAAGTTQSRPHFKCLLNRIVNLRVGTEALIREKSQIKD